MALGQALGVATKPSGGPRALPSGPLGFGQSHPSGPTPNPWPRAEFSWAELLLLFLIPAFRHSNIHTCLAELITQVVKKIEMTLNYFFFS